MPMMMRSGRMQSSTAEPSLRNSGLDTTCMSSARPWRASASSRRALMRWAVPTGEVDLLITTLASAACVAMVSATASTYFMSALPSSSGGVPTAMKMTSAKPTPRAASVVKYRRPAARLPWSNESRPGSKRGEWPALSWAIR
ncbi:hypothetical protein D9M68_413730 [compost metagenome]